MITEIRTLIYYTTRQFTEEERKQEYIFLCKLYDKAPNSKETFINLLFDLRKQKKKINEEILLTRKYLHKILKQNHPEEYNNLSWGHLINKCMKQK